MTSRASLWDGIVGQDDAVGLLRRAVATGRVAHAYAFVGPPGVGRRLTALAFAQACLCPEGGCGTCPSCRRVAAGQHPDCQVLAPTPPRDNPRGAAALRIEQVRELERWAALAPLAAPRKVFILDDADRMTLPTAQALLKTLEEPPPRTLLVLVVANPRALPPTVLSRCQRVRFRPLAETVAAALLEARGVDPGDSRLLARLSQGQIGPALATDLATVRTRRQTALALAAAPAVRIGLALDAAGLERPDRATAAALLETLWLWYRDALILAAGGDRALLVNEDCGDDVATLAARATPPALAGALSAIKEAWLALDGNVGPRLALEQALLAAGPTAGARGA
jgi:DNA polymerase-3 subunit delta'